MISFKRLIEEHNKAEQPQQHEDGHLFTKLKQNIMKKSLTQVDHKPSITYKKSVNQILKEFQLQFQILKLEKANSIAQTYFKTGTPVKELIQDAIKGLYQEIENIVNRTPQNLKQTKTTHHLESTQEYTEESGSINKEKSNKSRELTPKLIEFTLGAKDYSSAKQKQSEINGEQVSEFFVNSKGQISKNIRQKVMGQKKLK